MFDNDQEGVLFSIKRIQNLFILALNLDLTEFFVDPAEFWLDKTILASSSLSTYTYRSFFNFYLNFAASRSVYLQVFFSTFI